MSSMKTSALALAALCAMVPGGAALSHDTDTRGLPGSNNTDYRGWVGSAAQPGSHAAHYRSSGNTSSYNCANLVSGGNRHVRYPFTLPDSRRLESVRVWGDKLPGTVTTEFQLMRACTGPEQVDPVSTVLGTATLAGSPGAFTTLITTNNAQPNNVDCRYWLDVRFGSTADACALATTDLRITKVRVQSYLADRIFRSRFRANPP